VAEWEGFELVGAPGGEQVKADRGLERPASYRSRSSPPPLTHFATSLLRRPGACGPETVHGSPLPPLGVWLETASGCVATTIEAGSTIEPALNLSLF
jgi:hypothetical protein